MNNKEIALFTGEPAFATPLHVGRPNVGDSSTLLSRIEEILDRRWFTNSGPVVKEFEKRLANYLSVKHVIAMCNGTIALEIATRALGMEGEVICPSFTFIATAHSLQWQEIRPAFCDIDPSTHNLDPQQVEALITPKTKGIVGVHVWGRPCAIDAITEIARKHSIPVLFDASHAFACSANGGRMIGSFGDCEVFSFHATKFFNTFEGGAVATNNDELAEKMRLMKNFGFKGKDRVIYIGTNGKMNEVSAAMGLTGLESLETFIDHNRTNYVKYLECLYGIPGLSLVEYDNTEKNNYQYIIVEIDEKIAGLTRDELVRVLEAENVLARRYFFPGAHRMEPYRSLQPKTGLWLPETEALCERVLSLPTGMTIQCSDIESICNVIQMALTQTERVRKKLVEAV